MLSGCLRTAGPYVCPSSRCLGGVSAPMFEGAAIIVRATTGPVVRGIRQPLSGHLQSDCTRGAPLHSKVDREVSPRKPGGSAIVRVNP